MTKARFIIPLNGIGEVVREFTFDGDYRPVIPWPVYDDGKVLIVEFVHTHTESDVYCYQARKQDGAWEEPYISLR